MAYVPGRDSNRASPEYASRAVPLRQPPRFCYSVRAKTGTCRRYFPVSNIMSRSAVFDLLHADTQTDRQTDRHIWRSGSAHFDSFSLRRRLKSVTYSEMKWRTRRRRDTRPCKRLPSHRKRVQARCPHFRTDKSELMGVIINSASTSFMGQRSLFVLINCRFTKAS
jgi:hypothetical protein